MTPQLRCSRLTNLYQALVNLITSPHNNGHPPHVRKARLAVEELCERVVPAAFVWTGDGLDSLVSNGQNWDRNAAPGDGDALIFIGNTEADP